MGDKQAPKFTRYQQSIRAFRSQLATLKAKGLISKEIDVRKAKKTPALERQIAKYEDVATGNATALKVTPKELKEFQKLGYRTAKGRVLVEKMPEQIVASRRGTQIAFRTKGFHGFSRILLNIKAEDIHGYFDELESRAARWPDQGEDIRYGFRFFSNPSIRTYDTPADAVRDLRGYITVQATADRGNSTEQLQVIRNIEIMMADNDFVDWSDLPRPKKAGGPNSGRRRPGGKRSGSPRSKQSGRAVKRRSGNLLGRMSKASEDIFKKIREEDAALAASIKKNLKRPKKSAGIVTTVSKKTATRSKNTALQLKEAQEKIRELEKLLANVSKTAAKKPSKPRSKKRGNSSKKNHKR